MQSAREILLETSRQLNDQIRALEEALNTGDLAADRLEAMRREAAGALDRLRSTQGGAGAVGETIPKVIDHLDLFIEITGSAEAVPGLTKKLLRHLLEEQLELTAVAEKEPPTGGAGSEFIRSPAGEPGRGDDLLPGGRRPLSLGSLIGR